MNDRSPIPMFDTEANDARLDAAVLDVNRYLASVAGVTYPYTLSELRHAASGCSDVYYGALLTWAANEIELLRTLRDQSQPARDMDAWELFAALRAMGAE